MPDKNLSRCDPYGHIARAEQQRSEHIAAVRENTIEVGNVKQSIEDRINGLEELHRNNTKYQNIWTCVTTVIAIAALIVSIIK